MERKTILELTLLIMLLIYFGNATVSGNYPLVNGNNKSIEIPANLQPIQPIQHPKQESVRIIMPPKNKPKQNIIVSSNILMAKFDPVTKTTMSISLSQKEYSLLKELGKNMPSQKFNTFIEEHAFKLSKQEFISLIKQRKQKQESIVTLAKLNHF